MADVISLSDYMSARFFPEDVICGHCDADTRGRVYDSSACVVCTECGEPLLIVAPEDYVGFTVVTFRPEE